MAWSTPLTAVSNAALTAAQWNASVRDNLLLTPAAIATTPGSIFVTSAANAIVERVPVTQLIATLETLNATPYGNLATPGPAVTATSAAKALILTSGWMQLGTASQSVYMAHEISGATTAAASDNWALEHRGGQGTSDIVNATRAHLETALTAGSNTYTAKYRVSATNATAANVQRRQLTVIPF